jgi:hypothetical protein
MERPKRTVAVVCGDERPLGHECDDGKAQPAIASSREGTPPNVDDGTEKRHRGCAVASTARAAGDNRPLAMLARMASAAYFVQTRGYRFLLLGGPAVKVSGRSGEVGVGVVAHFSFGADGADCSWELSRLLNSMRGRQAARKQRELAETGAPPRGRLGLKGSSRERTCQAAIRTLRATADMAGFLPWRAGSSA